MLQCTITIKIERIFVYAVLPLRGEKLKELVQKLAREMMVKGLSVEDAKLVIGLLDSREHFEKALEEIRKEETLTRHGALAIAVLIADE